MFHLQVQRDKFSPRLDARFLVHKPQLIPQHKVRFIEFDLTDTGDSFLDIRAMNIGVQSTQQLAINLRVKQSSPDLLQKLLHRPMFQFSFIRLADQQAIGRKI
jgi:hypothetical protein